MSTTDSCVMCHNKYFLTIAEFMEDEEKSRTFLRRHGILPKSVKCPKCGKSCSYRSSACVWRCTNYRVDPKKKKRKYCSFSVSDAKGTFIEQARIRCWKLILFVNHFLSHLWDHKTVMNNLDISSRSTVNWRSCCSEVCENWLQNQDLIGGEGVHVEIDKTLIVQRTYDERKVLNQIWLFGGIERVSKRSFVLALVGPNEHREDDSLLPIIKKFILPGSVIYSDSSKAYSDLDHHYTHHMVDDVDKEDSSKHTQNIQRLWLDIKQWVKRPGIRPHFMYQYLARYLFIRSESDHSKLLHKFFFHAAKLYRHSSEKQES